MSWFGFLTGGSETAEKVVDGVSSGIDMTFFTQEEKSIAAQKVLEWKLNYAKATAGMSISRRVIVFVICAMWTLLVLLMVAIGLLAGQHSTAFTLLLTVMKDVVMQPFSIIIGFYFMAHVVGKGRGQP